MATAAGAIRAWFTHAPCPTPVQAFWAALASMTPAQQAGLLRFVTSCPRCTGVGAGGLSRPGHVAMGGGCGWLLAADVRMHRRLHRPPLLGFRYLEPPLAIQMVGQEGGHLCSCRVG